MKIITRHLFKFSNTLRSPINLDLLKTQQGKAQIQLNTQLRFKDPNLAHTLIEHYEGYRKNLYNFEQISKLVNDKNKELKQLIQKEPKNSLIDQLKAQLVSLKQNLNNSDALLKKSITQTNNLLGKIGNKVHEQTIISKNEDDNKILQYFHPKLGVTKVQADFNHKQFQAEYFFKSIPSKNYQQLTKQFEIADLTRGQKVSGHRGYFLCGNGLKLALALTQYALQHLQKHSYSNYQTPALILQQVLKDSCQLQTIQTDMYRFKEDGLCLIATSQQTLAGYYRGEVIQQKRLPLKMGGYSSCFRREAGAHGKDIHGLFRLHQFEKVQQFVICHPDRSESEMQRMISCSEQFYQSLGIPYRVIDIVSGQLNDAAIRKIDIEAWYPGQQRFRELVSVSNCTDYQSRLLETKFREGTVTKYPHMLNGTLVAIQRTLTCLIQHYYNPDRKVIQIPQVLQPFARTKQLK